MEYSETEAFTDRATQLVLRRQFETPEFTVQETATTLEIVTEHLHLRYDKKAFSAAGLSVSMRRRAQSSHFTTWHHGDAPKHPAGHLANLLGTARTLDDIDGAIELEPGILDVRGFAVVDDSASLLVTDDGWVDARPGPVEDLYFFGYGRSYQDALADYFRLTGPSPLLPRWALGNWWSRFYAYTASEYLELMDGFTRDGVPFSIAVIDMDWHVVDIDPALGSGWTGYTWNNALFPDPAEFLDELHERNLHVTLNVHPADGVRAHEEAYPTMALDLGLDPSTQVGIPFDVSSRDFVSSYLRRLHHPQEDIGVDFWWLDWQSGSSSGIAGLDPLWMLNEVHYRDSGRTGERPLTFSRYAGLGSHRTPVGFSGDTVTTWGSLDFQPYFTATAANVGYFWWSHDIGGHLGGVKDDELATRWFQFGVFSPINRLHSSSSIFNSKEPGRFNAQAQKVMTEFLRLRHVLVPYLYSAMWVSHVNGVGPIRPMYHDHPLAEAAYQVPNQYMFGPDLLVAPVTTPNDRASHLGMVKAWLPEGLWFDWFTGREYAGGRTLDLYRSLEQMPVLARAGSVIALAADPMADVGANPDALRLRVFAGASGSSVLIEDDGSAAPSEAQRTRVSLQWGESATLRIEAPTGAGVLVHRSITLDVVGVVSATVTVAAGLTARVDAGDRGRGLLIDLGLVDLSAGLEVVLTDLALSPVDIEGQVFDFLDQAEIPFAWKELAMNAVQRFSGVALISALHALDLPEPIFGPLLEIVSAR